MKKRNFDLGYHLVAFLDVLGQRERFRELRLPENPEEAATVSKRRRISLLPAATPYVLFRIVNPRGASFPTDLYSANIAR